MLSFLITIWGITNAILVLISIAKIKKHKDKVEFIWWWAFPTGSFVWEDMLVFGLLHAVIVLISIIFDNNVFWLISFLVFWIVRSAGEVLYQFLEQFIVPKYHPHDISSHFLPIRKIIGDISDQKCFILLQVFMQSILVFSILSLIYVLKYFTF